MQNKSFNLQESTQTSYTYNKDHEVYDHLEKENTPNTSTSLRLATATLHKQDCTYDLFGL